MKLCDISLCCVDEIKTNFLDKCYQEQNTAISIVSCKKPRMDDIPNICDGNDKMSKSVWTSTLPDKKPLLHLLSEQNIVCPAESKLSERRKCPQESGLKKFPVFLSIFVLFQRLPMNYK